MPQYVEVLAGKVELESGVWVWSLVYTLISNYSRRPNPSPFLLTFLMGLLYANFELLNTTMQTLSELRLVRCFVVIQIQLDMIQGSDLITPNDAWFYIWLRLYFYKMYRLQFY